MMAGNNINITIGGDPSGFTRAAREVTAGSDRMRNSLRDAAAAAPTLTNAVAATGTTLQNRVVPGANQATQALTNVGRVAQDLPFGFIGIQNNLNPLLESFQRLRAETGSNRAALAALGSSLTGAGGIGLALSAFTAVMSIASVGLGAWTRGFGSAEEKLTGFAKAIDDANKKAGDEIARVQVLNTVITDNTRKQSERKDAAKELSDILKDLNIKMSQEAILNGQVADATKKATEAIISRAKARAVEARIGELSGEQLQRDLKRAGLTDKLTEAQKELTKARAESAKAPSGLRSDVESREVAIAAERAAAVAKLNDQINSLDKDTASANKEIAFLISQIDKTDAKVETKGSGKQEVDLLKQRIAALKEIQSLQGLDAKQQVELAQLEIKQLNRDAVKLGFTPAEVKQQTQAILEKAFPVGTFEFDTVVTTRVNKLEPSLVKDAKALTDGFKTDIAKAIGIDGKPIEVPAPPITFTGVDAATLKAMEQFRAMAVEGVSGVADLLGQSLADAINGKSMGSILANAAKGLMNIVGGILQQVGKNMILASTAVEGLTKALNALFGPGGGLAGIAAGALLISVGGLIKNIEIPEFAKGGVVNRPTLGIFGERGPEAIMPLAKIPSLINDSLKDILPSMLNNLNVNNQQVVINGNMRVSGTDLSLMLERVSSRRSRLG